MITHTAKELAAICGARLEGDGEVRLVGAASLAEATGQHVSFVRDDRFAHKLRETRAGAVILPPGLDAGRTDLALLRSENPNRAFSLAITSFQPPDRVAAGVIDSGASIHPDAILGEGVSVGFGCSVGAGAKLEAGVVLYPGCVIGARVEIGADTVCHPSVVIYAGCSIGEGCTLHAGCVIGSDGFGFDHTENGWEKVPQCGTVEIGRDVELGANVTIDRGRFGPTRIGNGVKLDNLVHLAHNVTIEDGVLIAAQSGIAGSTRLGRGSILGGQVGVVGHLDIAPFVRVGAQTGVTTNLEAGKEYFGSPARPRVEVMRGIAHTARLPAMRQLLRELQDRVETLEKELREKS